MREGPAAHRARLRPPESEQRLSGAEAEHAIGHGERRRAEALGHSERSGAEALDGALSDDGNLAGGGDDGDVTGFVGAVVVFRCRESEGRQEQARNRGGVQSENSDAVGRGW